MTIRQVIFGITVLFLSSCSGYTKRDGKIFLRSSNEAKLGVNYAEVEHADYQTFKVIDHHLNIDLAKDKIHVFKGASILEYADPNTFEQVKEYFWKDKNNVYLLQFGGTEFKMQIRKLLE
jgi:hypothetical protein